MASTWPKANRTTASGAELHGINLRELSGVTERDRGLGCLDRDMLNWRLNMGMLELDWRGSCDAPLHPPSLVGSSCNARKTRDPGGLGESHYKGRTRCLVHAPAEAWQTLVLPNPPSRKLHQCSGRCA